MFKTPIQNKYTVKESWAADSDSKKENTKNAKTRADFFMLK